MLSGISRRSTLVAAILVVPIAMTAFSTIRDDVDAVREQGRLSAVEADVVPPFAFAGYRNVPLLLGIRRQVPADASLAFVARQSPAVYLRTGWVRWAAFVVAPRLVVDDPRAEWVVYVDGAPPHGARRAWRFGPDWLVQR